MGFDADLIRYDRDMANADRWNKKWGAIQRQRDLITRTLQNDTLEDRERRVLLKSAAQEILAELEWLEENT